MDLPRRNGLAVEQALREMQARLYAQAATVTSQATAIGSLAHRVDALERELVSRKALEVGHGPTVR